MAMTKPAGVFAQIVGVFIILWGLVVLGGDWFWGLVLIVLGVWLMHEGGKPARRKAPEG